VGTDQKRSDRGADRTKTAPRGPLRLNADSRLERFTRDGEIVNPEHIGLESPASNEQEAVTVFRLAHDRPFVGERVCLVDAAARADSDQRDVLRSPGRVLGFAGFPKA
jgi:hypothetical protein